MALVAAGAAPDLDVVAMRPPFGPQTATVPEFSFSCRCGRHWWHAHDAKWYTLTTHGNVPVELPTPECCHVRQEDVK